MINVALDNQGLIVQRDGDGGDCAARTGEYFTFLALRERLGISNADWPYGIDLKRNWFEVSRKLCTRDYSILRYINPPYSDLKDVSRDQIGPMVIAAGFLGDFNLVAGVWRNVKDRTLRFQNGDLCGPVDIAMFRRAFSMCGLKLNFGEKLEVIAGDIQLNGSALVRCIQAGNPDNVGDDINLTLYCFQATQEFPTTLSKSALLAYRKCRSSFAYDASNQTFIRTKGNGIQWAFDWYHRPETNANPFNELAKPVIERLAP